MGKNINDDLNELTKDTTKLMITNENKLTPDGLKSLKDDWKLLTSLGLITRPHKVNVITEGNRKGKKEQKYFDKIYEKNENGQKIGLIKHKSEFNDIKVNINANTLVIFTGSRHGKFIGIDIDVKGKSGLLTNAMYLVEVLKECPNNTLTCTTPSGGYHYVYKLSDQQFRRLALSKFNSELKLFDCDIDVLYNTSRFVMSGVYSFEGKQKFYNITNRTAPIQLPDVVYQEILRKLPDGAISSFEFSPCGDMLDIKKCVKCIHCKNIFYRNQKCTDGVGTFGIGKTKWLCISCDRDVFDIPFHKKIHERTKKDDEILKILDQYKEMKFDSFNEKNIKMVPAATEIIFNKNTSTENNLINDTNNKKDIILSHYLKCLKPQRCSENTEWFRLGAIIYNCKGSFILFNSWSKQCPEKYNLQACKDTWKIFAKASKKKAGMNTLKKLAQEDNPELYNEIINADKTNDDDDDENNYPYEDKALVRKIINKIINEKMVSHGILADLYYAIYGDTYIYDENGTDKKDKWFVFNKYGIYISYDDSLAPARYNIKNILTSKIEIVIQPKIEKLLQFLEDANDEDTRNNIKNALSQLTKVRHKIMMFLTTKSNLAGIIEFMKTYYGKKNIYDKMDKINKYVIGFDNGVYDLKTKTFRKGLPEELITCSTNMDYYKPEQKYFDYIDKLLIDFIPDEEERTYGLKKTSVCLIDGNPTEQFVVVHGPGSNGKTKYFALLKKMLGQYCGSMPASYFDKSIPSRNSDAPSETLASNKNSRLVIIDEIEQAFEISGTKIREITGGSLLTCRNLFGHNFKYVAGYLPVFITNYPLAFDMSAEHGIRRNDEWKIFRNEFVDNPSPDLKYQKKKITNLTDIIENDNGYALAMFHRLVDYLHMYMHDDKFNIKRPKLMEEERKNMITENDPIGSFMSEYVEKTDNYNDKIIGNELFASFIYFNKGNAMKFQQKVFYQILQNKHYDVKIFHKQKVVRNVRIKKPLPNPNHQANQNNDIDFLQDDDE
jgi:phage/plasmid-associated DNA primase